MVNSTQSASRSKRPTYGAFFFAKQILNLSPVLPVGCGLLSLTKPSVTRFNPINYRLLQKQRRQYAFSQISLGLGQREGQNVIPLLGPKFPVPSRGDHDILLPADAVSHGRRLTARR